MSDAKVEAKKSEGARKRVKTGGRKKGTPNKFDATALENMLCVFKRLGGTAGMARWAKRNQTQFYQIYAKRVPAAVELDAKVEGNVSVEVVQFTQPEPK